MTESCRIPAPIGPHTASPHTPLRGVAAIAALVVGAGIFCGSPALAADPTPSPSVSTTTAPGPTIHAAVGTSGLITVGDALRISTSISGADGAPVAAGLARIYVGTSAIATAEAMSAWTTNATSPSAFVELTETATAAVPDNASVTTDLTLAATDPILMSLAPGTYPVRVDVTAGGASASTTTLLTVRAAGLTDTAASIVVPVTTPSVRDGLLSASQLQELTSPRGALAEVLSGVSGAPRVLLAIDPAIPASIRALGSAAPASAVEWWHALEALPNDRFALQFADADVTTQFAAGLAEPLVPTSLESFLRAESFVNPPTLPSPTSTDSAGSPAVAEPAATPSPSNSATTTDPSAPVIPTTAELVAINTDFAALWPAEGNATDAVTAFAAGTSPVLVSSNRTNSAAGHQSIAGADVLAYNAEISDILSSAASEADGVARASWLAEASAMINLQQEATGRAPQFLTLARGTAWDGAALKSTIASLSFGSGIQAVSIADFLRMPAVPGALIPGEADPIHVAALTDMLGQEAEIAEFSVVLETPSLLTGRERARILRLLGAGWFGSSEFGTAIADQAERTRVILNSISIIQPTKVTLVSSGSKIPMFVKNDLPFTALVEIHATPNDVRVKVQARTQVTADPGVTTRVSIPVTAGISNGDVRIALELLASDGRTIIDHTKYADVSVRADWEAIGLGVLAALAILLFGFGTIRMVRRRRKAHAAGDTEDARPSRSEAREAFRQGSDDTAIAAQDDVDNETGSDDSGEGAVTPEEDSRG